MKSHTHLLLSSETRLKLRLLAAVYGVNMSNMAAKLIEEAYGADKQPVSKKAKRKVKKLIKKWA